MTAAKYDMVIEQGADFVLPIIWQDATEAPLNLAGYTARMQARATVTSPIVLIDASTTNSLITITPATGTVTISIPAAQTAQFGWSNAVYDLELVSASGFVYRLLEGAITVVKEVTRA